MTTQERKISEIVGQGYDDYWNSTKRYRILKGGKASKKSATTALNFIFRIMKIKDSNLLVVRQIMNTHRDSTFAQLQWAQGVLGVSHLWKNTVSPLEMTYLPTGQKIIFRGFDDVLKLASTTVPKGYLNFVWIEEGFEIAHEADFDKLDLSVPRGSINNTLTQSGANEVALGDSRADNATALITMRDAALLPLKIVKNRYYVFLEDVARIWADFWISHYGKRRIKIKKGDSYTYIPFDGDRYRGLIINTKIQVNNDTEYSEKEQLETLLTLFDKGIITKAELLERIPAGMVADVNSINREVLGNDGI